MASSQVEIATSSPFGCVLRDRNQRDGCNRNSGSKWRKFLVKDQNLHTCISIPPDSSTADENENSWLQNGLRLPASSDNSHGRSTNSNFKESDNFQSTKAKEMATIKTETLPSPRVDSLAVETPNLGAASLVQIWEKRLNRSNSGRNSNSVVSVESGSSCNENISFSSSSSPKGTQSEAGDSVFEEKFDSSSDWHSDRSVPSEQPSPCRSQNSDARESERVRVADIIKRLTASTQGLPCSSFGGIDNYRDRSNSNSPRDCLSPVSDQAEHRIFSPRIRGRQAFADLLMQMEKERHGELNALIERRPVSRFPQKGRIQSMLRLRLLQRGSTVQDQQRPQFAAASPVDKLPQGSSIMHLRERFSIGVEQGATSQTDVTTNPRSPSRETANNTTNLENSSIPNKPDKQVNFIEQQDKTAPVRDPPAHNISDEPGPLTPMQDPLVHNNKDTQEEPDPVQDTKTSIQDPPVHNIEDIQEEPEPLTPVQDPPVHYIEDIQEGPGPLTPVQDPSTHRIEDIHEEPDRLTLIEDTATIVRHPSMPNIEDIHEDPCPSSSLASQEMSLAYRNLDAQETGSKDRNLALEEAAEATTSYGGWDGTDVAEELEESYQEYAETSYDWINDISRPRSYWENLRQEWYHEMLNSNSNSNNAEIRRLLERGTVSSFLASDFREKMDRLIESRLEVTRAQPVNGSLGGEEDEEHSQLMSFPKNHKQQQQQQHKPEELKTEGEGQEQQEEEILINGQYQEASDYFVQSTPPILQGLSPTILRSWSFGDSEVGEDSDRAASTSPRQDFQSQPYYHKGRQCSSSRHHPSIEMELVRELRGQMEQLYSEMSEIRKSLKSCMDMQMILMQQSTKQELHSVEGEKKSFGRALPKKRNCCVCNEAKIDSFLYRCGHMCTCLKCADELQRSSGKCPICCAPIVDVVRAYLEWDS